MESWILWTIAALLLFITELMTTGFAVICLSIGAGAAAIAESKTDPATYMLLTKYVDAIKEIGSGEQSKTVFLPFEASNLVGTLGSLTELLPKK